MLALLSLLGIAIAGMALVPSIQGDGSDDAPVSEDDLAEREPDETDSGLDWLFPGTEGDDHLQTGAENDVIGGRGGADILNGFDGNDIVAGGADGDALHGGRDDDLLFGGTGDDEMFGHVDDDALAGGEGNDTLNGGGGDDLLFGGTGDDTLQGSWDNDLMFGGAGADVLHGGAGNDLVDGRDGELLATADFLNGGADDDTLIGGAFDVMNGGTGADIFNLEANSAGTATVEDFSTEDTLVLLYDGTGAEPELTVEESNGGSILMADGNPVAVLAGVIGLELSNVQLVAA